VLKDDAPPSGDARAKATATFNRPENRIDAATNAKSCEPEGPQDLTERLSHAAVGPSNDVRHHGFQPAAHSCAPWSVADALAHICRRIFDSSPTKPEALREPARGRLAELGRSQFSQQIVDQLWNNAVETHRDPMQIADA
jgi:hypothetical protein